MKPDPKLILAAVEGHGPDSIMWIDREGVIAYISRTAPGLTIEQVLGTSIYAYLPPASQETARNCMARVAASKEADQYEVIYEVDENVKTQWRSTVVPVVDDGEVTNFIILSYDVTSDTTVRRERDRMFELSEDLLCVIEADGTLKRVNPAWEKVLGYSLEEVEGRSFAELMAPEDVEASMKAFQEGHLEPEGGRAGGFTNRCLHKDGSHRTVQWSGATDPESGLAFAAGRDVTGQRALEEQLRQSQKMDAIGQLAGGLAHDFNNLMQAVLGNVYFARSSEPSPGMKGFLDDIEAAAERAAALTKQLLTFSRAERLTFEDVDVNVLSRTLMRLLRRVIPEHIEIDFIAGHKLGVVSADKSQLEQLIMNLCLNARDAMPDGGRITIETENVLINGTFREAHPWAKPGRYVQLSITDTGIGMSEEVRARVFEPFFTTKAPGEGTGLGLSVVYGVVEQHGGMIHVYSEPGQGTTFKVYLPVVERLASEVGPKLDEPRRKGVELILLAEDEELVRNLVCRFLERSGYRVLTAVNGGEALKMCREHDDIALAILDVVMPELGGPEAYALIHDVRPELPVIFASGYHDRSRFVTDVPPDAPILSKPFQLDDLLVHVKRLLESR